MVRILQFPVLLLSVALLIWASSATAKAPPPWPDDPAATVVSLHPDGTPKTLEVRHSDGSRTEYRTWPGGARRWEFHYDADRKEHGTCTRWNPAGPVFVEEHWEHGVRVGTWYYDNDDGTRNGRFTFENGREVSHETWFSVENRWIPFKGPKAFPTP